MGRAGKRRHPARTHGAARAKDDGHGGKEPAAHAYGVSFSVGCAKAMATHIQSEKSIVRRAHALLHELLRSHAWAPRTMDITSEVVTAQRLCPPYGVFTEYPRLPRAPRQARRGP